jgi:membrane protease subunit HflK
MTSDPLPTTRIPKADPPAGKTASRWGRRLVITAIVALAIVWLASGFVFVQPDERAVIRRFGRIVEPQGSPGLHFAWPWPIGRVDQPKTREVKRVTVGMDPQARAAIAAGDLVAASKSPESDLFTGDENIVKATMVAQYQISAADRYVTRCTDPDRLVTLAVKSVMVESLGGYSIDEALTEGKALIQNAVAQRAQAMLDRYACGITLIGVTLESTEPPHAIADAFRDVASAKKDQERQIDQAESYANQMLPRAQGQAYEMLADARAFRDRRVQLALGEAASFRALHAEYVKSPAVTRMRLLLETLSTVVERADTYVLPPESDGPPLRLTIGQSGVQ